MNVWPLKIIALALVASLLHGASGCPCAISGQHAQATAVAAAPPEKCPHCAKTPVQTPAPKSTPSESCPHCNKAMAVGDRAYDAIGHHVAMQWVGCILPAAPCLGQPAFLPVAVSGESVPIPPRLADLFHSSCLLTL